MQNSLLHQPHLCSNGGTGLQFLLPFDMLVDGPKKKKSIKICALSKITVSQRIGLNVLLASFLNINMI